MQPFTVIPISFFFISQDTFHLNTHTHGYPFPWNMIFQRIFRNSMCIRVIFSQRLKKIKIKIKKKTLTINFRNHNTGHFSTIKYRKPVHIQVHLSTTYTMEETRNAKYESDSQWNFQLKMYKEITVKTKIRTKPIT